MEWEEFTTYIVESGLHASAEEPDGNSTLPACEAVGGYVQTQTRHCKNVLFSKTRAIGAIEENSPYLKIYNSQCNLLCQLKARVAPSFVRSTYLNYGSM